MPLLLTRTAMFSKTTFIYPTLRYVYICAAKWPDIVSLSLCILFFTSPKPQLSPHISEEKEKAVIIALQ